jgi:hypothetical protein
MQDQSNALGQLGGVLGQGREQDIGMAGQNANLQQQRNLQQGAFQQQSNLANQQAQLAQTGMNDAANQGYLGQMLGMDQQSFQNEMAKRQLGMQDQGHFGQLLQLGGGLLAGPLGQSLFSSKPGGGGGNPYNPTTSGMGGGTLGGTPMSGGIGDPSGWFNPSGGYGQ